ncbi:MAG: hypothetical protein HQL54_02630 [Magnetococcales bacterium]|nr:hypothetical protein [Magnetococcales bacterium]
MQISKEKTERDRLLAHLYLMREALLKTPHGMGDHSDRCRAANSGLCPNPPEKCQCHVHRIRQVLEEDFEALDALVNLLGAVRRSVKGEQQESSEPCQVWHPVKEALQALDVER